ncbi:MAG: hypothetical protein HYR70_07450, partial [Chloroflexi bacterium]|nr:hypothetical protein [Chloroflexota bacterium]
MSLKKYSEALKVFDNYTNPKPDSTGTMPKPGTDSLVKQAIKKEKSCYFALDTLTPRKPIKVRMMDSIVFNRGTSSFAAMYYENDSKVLFTSARKGGVVTDPEKQDSRYFCDVYTSVIEDTIWQRPVNFGRT